MTVRGGGDRLRRLAEAAPVGVFAADENGILTFANARLCDLMGRTREDVMENGWESSIHPGDRSAVAQAGEDARRAAGEHRIRHRLLATDGRVVSVLTGVTALRDGDGRLDGVAGTVTDLTGWEDDENALPSDDAPFRTLCAQAPVAVVRFDATGAPVWANARWEAITGRSMRDLFEGRLRVVDVFHPEEREEIARDWSAWVASHSDQEVTREQRVMRPDGEVRWVSGTAVTSRDPSGVTTGRFIVLTDVTPQKLAEEDLRESRAYLARAQEIAGVGAWDLDTSTGRLRVSDNVYEMSGIAGGTEPLLPALMATVHPEDRDRVETELKAASHAHGITRITCRIHHTRSGQERVLSLHAQPEGRGHLRGTVMDLTRQVDAERRLARAQEIAHLGSWDWDIVTGDLAWSDEIYRIFGLEPQQFGATYAAFLERVHPHDRAAVEAAVGHAIASHAPYAIEHRVVRPSGEERIVHEQGEVSYAPDGTPLHMLGTVLDVTERKRVEDDLQEKQAYLARAQEIAGMGVWDLDLASGHMHWSDNIHEMTGVAPGTTPLFPALMDAVHPDDRSRLAAALQGAGRSGAPPAEITYRIRHSRTGREHLLRINAEAQDEGRLLGTVIDLTQQVESERRLARTQEIAHLGSWDWDIQSGAAAWSDETSRILGLPVGEMEPTYETFAERIHPDDRAGFEQHLRESLTGGSAYRNEYRVVHPDGQERIVLDQAEVTYAPDGTPLRMTGSLLDITERARAENALRASEERFRRLADHAPVGIYETDADGGCRWVNERWCQIAGISAEDALGAGWIAAIHPEDRENVLSTWRRAVRAGTPIANEYRLKSSDGRISWVTGNAVALTGADGTVSGYLGTITDVTERARSEREQRALQRVATAVASDAPSRAIFALVAEQVADVIDVPMCSVVHFDAGDGVAVVVGGWSNTLGTATAGTRLPLDDTRILARVFHAGHAVRSNDPRDFDDVTGSSREPETVTVDVSAAPVWMGRALWGAIAVANAGFDLPSDTDDRLERFCELVSLALANADARRQLATLASTDHLTGLPNRRSFQERLAAEVDRAQQRGRPLSLVVLDLDHFKDINDTYGHEVGDRVLAEFARRLGGLARTGETVARIGGEEFAWIMPEADAMGGLAGADRVRETVAAEPFPVVGALTVSGGVCDMEQAADAAELFRLADVALYWAKGQGRNAVFRYSPEVMELLSADEQERRMGHARILSGVRALANAVAAKDATTQRHAERVAPLVEQLALAGGWTPERAARLREAALVHDVGMIGISDGILSKGGRLDENEYSEVQRHATLGAQMLEGLLDDEQVSWVRHHHERWDGSGYPDRLAGSAIPDGAALLAVADAWDSMSTRRYGSHLAPEEGVREMKRLAGTQFDPDVVEVFERLRRRGGLDTGGGEAGLSS